MFAKQWHGHADEVIVVDDHITGVLTEHQAGRFLDMKAENDEIANQAAPATFENTLKRMETAGLPLQRLIAIYGVHSSNLKVGPMPEIERVVMPMLAEYVLGRCGALP